MNWKPFWLLWSHDRKAPYANDVGQKRLQQKTTYPLGKIADPPENDPVFDSFD